MVWPSLFCSVGRGGVWNGLDVLVVTYTWPVVILLLTRSNQHGPAISPGSIENDVIDLSITGRA